MSDLKDAYDGHAGPALTHDEYVMRDVLLFYKQSGIRKPQLPHRIEHRVSLKPTEIIEITAKLAEEGLLQSRQMGRRVGPFSMQGYILTRAGEERLEKLQGQDSATIEIRAMLHLLNKAASTRRATTPYLGYMTDERIDHLVDELVKQRCLIKNEDGTVRATPHGKAFLARFADDPTFSNKPK